MRPAAEKPAENLIPLLVDARTAARLCGCGLSLWYSLDSKGAVPQSIVLNSKRVWSFDQLRLWATSGCPSRDSAEWATILARLREVHP
jgi:hypothetical protein